jgi:hypothetical protein
MKLTIPAIVVLNVALISVAPALGAEKKITRSELPVQVLKTADKSAQGATVRGYSQETENGNTYYEVEMIVGGHHKDVLIDSTGAVAEIEEEASLRSLPAEIQASLTNRAAGGTIKTVESITKHGKLVAYEAQILTNGRKSEIQVGPDGEPLAHDE